MLTDQPLSTDLDFLDGVIDRLIEKRECEDSLYSFLQHAWPYMETGTFTPNWHLKMLSEILEEVFRGNIRRLVINIPPRYGKTSLVSVAFPAWCWIQNPQTRLYFCSYAQKIVTSPSQKCRRLILSEWYQSHWGDKVTISPSQKAKGTFENTAGGRRDTTSVGSSISGLGGDILIADDQNNPKDVESEAKMHSTNLWWRDVWQSRLDDAKAGAMIEVQQRVSEKDITALILKQDKDGLWTKVILPACFEPSRRCVVKAAGKTWKDPRTKDGELLFPARFPQSVIDEQKATMSEYAFAGQYQQRPAPQEGGLFKHEDFMVWSSPMPRFKMIVTSVDTALTTHESSSFSAATSWGVFQYDGESHLMLLSLMKARLPFEELMEQIRRMAIDCTDSNPEYPKRPHTIKHEYKTSLFVVERATQGQPLISFLEKMRPRVRVEGFVPRTYGSKLARAKTIRYFLGPRGIIWLPATRLEQGNSSDNYSLYDHSQKFVEDVLVYPNGTGEDVVDTFSQSILFLQEFGLIKSGYDVEVPEY